MFPEHDGHCNIPRFSDPMNASLFLKDYAVRGQPVLLTRYAAREWADPGAAAASIAQRFREDHFLRTYGAKYVMIHERERGFQTGTDSFGTLREFVETHMGHCRQQQHHVFFTSAQALYKAPELRDAFLDTDSFAPLMADTHIIANLTDKLGFYPSDDIKRYFLIGSLGSGLNWHKHGDAFAEVLVGRKRWLLCPQNATCAQNIQFNVDDELPNAPTTTHDYDGLSNLRRTLVRDTPWTFLAATDERSRQAHNDSGNDGDGSGTGILECTTGPGEVLYIPAGFFHTTLNLGEVLTMTTQPGSVTMKREEDGKLVYMNGMTVDDDVAEELVEGSGWG